MEEGKKVRFSIVIEEGGAQFVKISGYYQNSSNAINCFYLIY